MEESNSQSTNDLLPELFGKNSQDQFNTDVSDFERELFKHGVYEFDVESEINRSELEYHEQQRWLQENQPLEEQNYLENLVKSKKHDLTWKQFFSGQIPKSWVNHWDYVIRAFEESGKRGIQLSKTLVNAGVGHYHPIVVNKAGINQRLSVEQLGLVLAREDIPKWNSDQIIQAQIQKGMTSQEMRTAKEIAARIRAKMSKSEPSRHTSEKSSKFNVKSSFKGR